MIRIVSPSSVYATTNNLCRAETPNVMNRCSSKEWSGSTSVLDRGSNRAVLASSKETPCFQTLDLALNGSHSKVICRREVTAFAGFWGLLSITNLRAPDTDCAGRNKVSLFAG